jgi:spermidine/putrescine transport system ATP-binding protein
VAAHDQTANALRGRVTDASFLGVSTTYVVRTQGGTDLTVYAQNTGGAGLETLGPGREVVLSWEPPNTFVVAKEDDHAT